MASPELGNGDIQRKLRKARVNKDLEKIENEILELGRENGAWIRRGEEVFGEI